MLLLALLACAEPPLTEAEVTEQVAAATDEKQRLILLEVHVTRNPESANAHLWLARAYRERSDPRAAELFEKAAALDPTNPIPRVELAYFLIEPALRRGIDPPREDLDRALALGLEAAAVSPTCDTRNHLVGLYEIRLDAGIVDEGLQTWLDESLAACTTDVNHTLMWQATKGRAYAKAGAKGDAEKWLCEAAVDGNATAARECLDAVKDNGGNPCDAPARLHQDGEAWVAALTHWDCSG